LKLVMSEDNLKPEHLVLAVELYPVESV